MLFQIYFTSQREGDEYPAGAERIVERHRLEGARWRTDPRQMASWLSQGNEVDPDGTPVSVRSAHRIEVETLGQLVALSEQYGQIIIAAYGDGAPSLEIYNDYRE